jgi:hypothetical protein
MPHVRLITVSPQWTSLQLPGSFRTRIGLTQDEWLPSGALSYQGTVGTQRTR